MLRVAVIGCGKIADQHVIAISRIPIARLVAVCDRELLMAEQLAERYSISHACADVSRLLEEVRPDVVHITTPPQSHASLAIQCLEAGSHVYVEKPFTVNIQEAVNVIRCAEEQGLKVTAGHNLQYTHENVEARRLVRDGFLGGPPVHIESYYTYAFGNAAYAKAFLADRNHWIRRLPGKLLHNIISHGIARVAEFMECDRPFVAAYGHTSPLLRTVGEIELIDELRVHLYDGENTTGTFVFSSQISPPVNGLRLYGHENSLFVDNVHRTLIRYRRGNYKSFLNYFIPPLWMARENVRSTTSNIWRFLRSDFHDDSGLKNLVEAFYRAVLNEKPLPVSYREILFTASVMDEVFNQLETAQSRTASRAGEDSVQARA